MQREFVNCLGESIVVTVDHVASTDALAIEVAYQFKFETVWSLESNDLFEVEK